MGFAPGEKMRFGFTGVGRAAGFIPYYVDAFSRISDEGVGHLRVRYRLERVVARNQLAGTQEEIFDGEVVKNRTLATVWENAVSAPRRMENGFGSSSCPDCRNVQGWSVLRSTVVRHAGSSAPDPYPPALRRPLRRDLARGLQGAGGAAGEVETTLTISAGRSVAPSSP